MKKILLFACDPGGANTIIPLIKPLEETGYQVFLYGKGIALTKYADTGYDGMDIQDELEANNLSSVQAFLQSHAFDFLITGTSATDFTEKHLWKCAADLKIPSFAILDQWMNYGIRFSKYPLTQIEAYNQDKTHDYLPSKIIVMDDYAKQKMMEEGIPASNILVCGQPHFDYLKESAAQIPAKSLAAYRKSLHSDILIVYASEPLTQTYENKYWGFDEKTILEELLSAVTPLAASKQIAIIIRPHPKDHKDNFYPLINQWQASNLKIIVDDKTNGYLLIQASDLVCGMSSMFLIESVILGKPVMSIQIGLCRENPFILDHMKVNKSILTKDELSLKMQQFMHGDLEFSKFELPRNVSANIIKNMEEMLDEKARN